MSSGQTPLAGAEELYDAGYDPLVVPLGGKECFETGWSKMEITREGLKERFGDNGQRSNVGARWGRGGRFDVDLDCWEARALALYFLPPTQARIGRKSARNGHYFYASKTGTAPASIRTFNDPDAPPAKKGDHKVRILELLGRGTQTVMPGSIHESGEEIAWEQNGPPAVVDPKEAIRAIHRIAAATLIVRRWKEGQRQDLALRLAGALLRAGWTEKETAEFLIAINAVAPEGEDDERTKKRLWEAVTGTSAKLSKGENVEGLPTLGKLIGNKEVTDRFAEWLGLGKGQYTAPDGDAATAQQGAGRDQDRANGREGGESDAARGQTAGQGAAHGVWRRMSSVQRKKASALWKGYLYLGKLNLIGGDPSAGKSFLTMAIVAHATRGWPWPDGSPCCAPMNVILVCGEDDPEDTIGPRLDAVDADSDRVILWDGMATDDGSQRRPSLAKTLDIEELRRKIVEEDVRLVVIDPLNPFLDDKTDTNRGNAVRAVTTPLADLARETGAAIIVVMHLNKSEMQHALYRISGSIDFIAAARSALTVGHDPENEEGRRLILSIKNNLEKQPPGQGFYIEGSSLRWDKEPVNVTAQQMLSAQPGSTAQSKREQAAAGLRAILANGAQFAFYVYAITDAFGVGKRTVDQAKSDLGITLTKVPTPDGKTRWTWQLPAHDKGDAQATGDEHDGGGDKEDVEAEDRDRDADAGRDADAEAVRLCNLATLNGSMAESASEPAVGVESEPSPSVDTAQYTADATMPLKVARLQRLEGEDGDGGLEAGPPCWSCSGTTYWMRGPEAGGGPVCAACHPQASVATISVPDGQGVAS